MKSTTSNESEALTNRRDEQMDALLHLISAKNDFEDGVMEELTAPKGPYLPTEFSPTFPQATALEKIFNSVHVKQSWLLPTIAVACLVLIMSSVAVLNQASTLPTEPSLITLHEMRGEVIVSGPDGQYSEADLAKAVIQDGTLIEVGREGSLTIQYNEPSGVTLVTLDSGTRFRLLKNGSYKRWHLESGRLRANVAPQAEPLQIIGAHATASVLGTQFELSTTVDQTSLHVTEGRVQLHATTGESILVQAGQIAHATREDSTVYLALIHDTPMRRPELKSIGIRPVLSENKKNRFYRLRDGGTLKGAAKKNPVNDLILLLEHDCAINVEVELTSSDGEQLLSWMETIDAPQIAWQNDTIKAQKIQEYALRLPDLGTLPNGYVTMSVHVGCPDEAMDRFQPVSRMLTFAVQ